MHWRRSELPDGRDKPPRLAQFLLTILAAARVRDQQIWRPG